MRGVYIDQFVFYYLTFVPYFNTPLLIMFIVNSMFEF